MNHEEEPYHIVWGKGIALSLRGHGHDGDGVDVAVIYDLASEAWQSSFANGGDAWCIVTAADPERLDLERAVEGYVATSFDSPAVEAVRKAAERGASFEALCAAASAARKRGG